MSTPLLPDEGTARRLLREELADPVYEAARPGPIGQALRGLWELLTSLELPGGPGGVGLAVLLAVLAVAVVVGVRAAGRPFAGGRSGHPSALVDSAATAEQYRAAAARGRAAGDHAGALRDAFRAVVRGCEERALLVPDPGRTADEAAREVAGWLPALAPDLTAVARRFDDVTYGSHPATSADAERARRLDEDVAAARATPARPAGPSGVAGRGTPTAVPW